MKNLFMVLTMCITMMFAGQAFADATATADVDAVSAIGEAGTIKDSFNSGPGKRGLYIMNQATFIPPASYFGPNETGHQFFPLQTLLHFKNVWTITEAQNMLKNKKGGKDVEIRPVILPEEGTELPNEIKCVLVDPDNFAVVGFGAIAANDDGSISPDVFAAALIEARKLNANTVQFLAEGKNVRLTATGWGINLNGGISAIGGDDDSSSATGGGGFAGTGYSSYESGYVNMPWLQMVFLRVEPVEKKTLEVKESEVKNVIKVSESIMFDYDSDVIRIDQEKILNDIADYLVEYPDTLLVIKGYASEEGTKSYNLDLSTRRAKAVEKALISRNVSPEKIKLVIGEGETTMFNNLLDGNRRVVVVTIGK